MKKIVALVMAAAMILVSFAAMAEVPEGYPEVKEGLDLGGKTIYILNYWSAEDGDKRKEDPTEEQQLKYDFYDWIMETYNCNIVVKKGGSYSELHKNMMEYVANPDLSYYCIYQIHSEYAMSVVANGYCAGWDMSAFDYSTGYWNTACDDFLTVGDKHYAPANTASSPVNMIFFNKRLCEEAGIDWNSIYDMQAEGTWTWAAFEELLAKATRDIDNDGIIDVYGLGGDYRLLVQLVPYLNGGKYFDFDENGKMAAYGGSDEVLEALNWADKLIDNYYYDETNPLKTPGFEAGKYTFGMFKATVGFDGSGTLHAMEDEWGAVAFPLPNGGTNYLNAYSDNYNLIPNVYTEEEISEISYIYSLYAGPVPGVDSSTSWIGDKYMYTDERAVDETYAMLRDPAHGYYERASYMEGTDEMIDDYLSWDIGQHGRTPAECIEAALPDWQAACDAFNNR